MAATRFNEIEWATPDLSKNIRIFGLGGVGSWVALFVNSIGTHTVVGYDKDIVSQVNVSNSFISRNSNHPKSVESAINCSNFCNQEISYKTFNVDIATLNLEDMKASSDVWVSAVDSMVIRKQLFECWVANGIKGLFIDCRMAAETGSVLAVFDQESADYYRTRLFDDSEAIILSCGNKATRHCAAGLASIAMSIINNWILNDNEGIQYRNTAYETKLDMIMNSPITTVRYE